MSEETIGDRIKLRLKALGINQTQLSVLLGMTRANVSHYVTNKHNVPANVLPKLALALSCSEQWLKHGTE